MHWYWDTLKTELGDVHWSGTGTPSKQCWMDAHWYWDTLKTVLGGCAPVLGHSHPQNRVGHGWMCTGTGTPSRVGWMCTGTGTPPKQCWVDAHWYWDTLKTELGGCTLVLGHPQNRAGWMHTGTGTLSKQCWVDAHQYWDTPIPKTELGMGGCALVLGHPQNKGRG